MADPTGRLRACDVAAQTLVALPADTPSLRLLADQTAEVLAAISHALNGLALLVAILPGRFLAAAASVACAYPTGFPRWSMRDAHSS